MNPAPIERVLLSYFVGGSERSEKSTVSLAGVGQHVMIAPGGTLRPDERGVIFEITAVVGVGDDAFVTLKDANGMRHKWFRVTDLTPATTMTKAHTLGVKPPTADQEDTMNSSTTRLLALAETYAKAHHCSLSQAVTRISANDPVLTAAYRDEVGAGAEPPAAPVISLRTHSDATEELMSLASNIARDKHIALSVAVKEVGRLRPDLAMAWERG